MGIGVVIGIILGMAIYYFYGKWSGNNCDCDKVCKTGTTCKAGMRSSMTNGMTVYWFHRPGCPHCVNMKDAWYNLKQQMPNHNLVSIDTSLPQNQALANKFGVNGVPHIVKVDSNGNKSVYKGNRSTADMKQWVMN